MPSKVIVDSTNKKDDGKNVIDLMSSRKMNHKKLSAGIAILAFFSIGGIIFFCNEKLAYSSVSLLTKEISEKTDDSSSSISSGNHNKNCLSLDSNMGMDQLLAKYKQVFVLAPEKAAGTAYQQFSFKCMKSVNMKPFNDAKFLGQDELAMKQFTAQLEVPSLVAAHVNKRYDQYFIDAMKLDPDRTLIIYSYRKEISRLHSAVRQVIERDCYPPIQKGWKRPEGFIIKESKCYVEESTLIKFIQRKRFEIGGSYFLSCKVYDAIRENSPNLVIANYKQASKLQKLLSKYHCSQLKENYVEANIGTDKEVVYVNITEKTNVTLDEWLDAKSGLLEFMLNLTNSASCLGTTRDIQDALLQCSDETIQISGRSHDNQKLSFEF